MNGKLNRLCLYSSLVVSSLIILGCGQQSYNKRYYVLEAVREANHISTKRESILSVQRFTIDSAFESKGLVYRKSEFEYESDFYNEFLISPAVMITEKTRNWLAASGIFARVLDKGSYAEPTHTLKGNITALYGDLRNRKAIIEMRIFLIASAAREESVILARTYTSSCGLHSETTEGLIEAFDSCLRQILIDLERDLGESPP